MWYLRLYLLCRSYGLHGQVSTDSGTQHSTGDTVGRAGKNRDELYKLNFFLFLLIAVQFIVPTYSAVLLVLCTLWYLCSDLCLAWCPLQSWSNHLERWARYVIRCEIEYPGPIDTFTNFGKVDRVSKSHFRRSVDHTLNRVSRSYLDRVSRSPTKQGQ